MVNKGYKTIITLYGNLVVNMQQPKKKSNGFTGIDQVSVKIKLKLFFDNLDKLC